MIDLGLGRLVLTDKVVVGVLVVPGLAEGG